MKQIIKDFLLEHSTLSIKKLGTFEIVYKSAEIHPVLHTFTPPGNYVVFTKNEKVDSDELIKYLSEKQNISIQEATDKTTKWVDELKEKIKTDKTFSLGSLGDFSLDSVGNLIFISSLDTDISPESYGLESFTFPPSSIHEKEEKSTDVINEEKTIQPTPKIKKRKGIALYVLLIIILLPIIGLGIYAALYTNDFIQIKKDISYEITQWFQQKENKYLESKIDTTSSFEVFVEDPYDYTSVVSEIDMNEEVAIEETEEFDEIEVLPVSEIGNTYIVLGSFKSQENAQIFLMQKQEEHPNIKDLGQGKTSGLWLIGLGPYEETEAQQLLNEKKVKGWIFRK